VIGARANGGAPDIQVKGPCSETELLLIERLAQAASDRPVIVHRAGLPATRETSKEGHKPP
jgi:hypothetical protein